MKRVTSGILKAAAIQKGAVSDCSYWHTCRDGDRVLVDRYAVKGDGIFRVGLPFGEVTLRAIVEDGLRVGADGIHGPFDDKLSFEIIRYPRIPGLRAFFCPQKITRFRYLPGKRVIVAQTGDIRRRIKRDAFIELSLYMSDGRPLHPALLGCAARQ
jgi:hypothetical protein